VMKFRTDVYDGEDELPALRIGDIVGAMSVECDDIPSFKDVMKREGLSVGLIEDVDLGDMATGKCFMKWVHDYCITGHLVGRTDDTLRIETADNKVHEVGVHDILAILQTENRE